MSGPGIDREQLVRDLLALAASEPGGLNPERLAALGRGLFERAEAIVRDRQRIDQLTEERDWARQTLEATRGEIVTREKERRWLLETLAQRDEEQGWLEQLLEVAERERAREREALQAEHARASEAHDTLLGHHRDLLARLAEEMRRGAAAPRWSGETRRRLAELAELLEQELK